MHSAPYRPADFRWVRWTARDIRVAARHALVRKRAALASIKTIPREERTFENTVYALERAQGELAIVARKIDLLLNLSPVKAVRVAAKNALVRIEKISIALEYDEDVYRAVQHYAARKERLQGPDKKLFTEMLRDYRRMGFGLSRAVRRKLQDDFTRLGRRTTDFMKAINDHGDFILATRDQLAGLPAHYIAQLPRTNDGRYRVTLQYPHLHPFLELADDGTKRYELASKNLQRGGRKNLVILREMIRLRHAIARRLGYAHYPDYAIEVRMARTARRARSFVTGLLRRLAPLVRREMKDLEFLKREFVDDPQAHLLFSDIAYYSNKLRERRYGLDPEKLREFFPFETVKKGTFAVYEKLFSVRFTRLTGYPSWHPEVEFYKVSDRSGFLRGYFALDLYPREGKYGHAAASNVIPGHRTAYGDEGAYVPPFSVMMTNFPKPRPKYPSLLSHDEVETYFHEFGHIVHGVLTRAPYVSQSGTSVDHDFVEAPSQMLEYWVWEPKTLAALSGHYRTGKKLGGKLLKQLVASRMHLIGHWSVRQLLMAYYDLRMHLDGSGRNIAPLYARLVKRYIGVALPRDQIFAAGWGHMTDYAAGYYSYMWSRVYAADMFTRFKKEGIMSARTGGEYRRMILEPGSSREEMDSVREFLGRAPNAQAILREIGLS